MHVVEYVCGCSTCIISEMRNRHQINHNDACCYGAPKITSTNQIQKSQTVRMHACKLTKKTNSWHTHHACTTCIDISFYVYKSKQKTHVCDTWVMHVWHQIKERHYSPDLCTWCHTVSNDHSCLPLGLGTRLGLTFRFNSTECFL